MEIQKNKKVMRREDQIFDNNVDIAAKGLLGFAVRKLAPSKENLKKFKKQNKERLIEQHYLCGCFSCMELAKIFVMSSHDIREAVITESMKELENK